MTVGQLMAQLLLLPEEAAELPVKLWVGDDYLSPTLFTGKQGPGAAVVGPVVRGFVPTHHEAVYIMRSPNEQTTS